jgi:hypothetical protein
MKMYITKIDFLCYPDPKGSRENQFAPLPDGKAGFRDGVNKLISTVIS